MGEMKNELDTLTHRIDECIFKDHTPDKPRLRYGGPIPVLIIDDLQQYNMMLNLDLREGKDYVIESYRALTNSEFSPFIGSRGGSKFAVVPYDPLWARTCSNPIKGLEGQAPRRVVGRLIRCSLRAIETIDAYYRNGFARRRIKVGVKSALVDGGTTSAWVYFTPETHFLRWDPHTNDYSPLSGMEVQPFLRDMTDNCLRIPYDFKTIQTRS